MMQFKTKNIHKILTLIFSILFLLVLFVAPTSKYICEDSASCYSVFNYTKLVAEFIPFLCLTWIQNNHIYLKKISILYFLIYALVLILIPEYPSPGFSFLERGVAAQAMILFFIGILTAYFLGDIIRRMNK